MTRWKRAVESIAAQHRPATDGETFPPDYASARERFRQSASRLGWATEVHPVGVAGPGGGELTVDMGASPGGDPRRVLILSSGLHGVEGFFGSAVQVALLERWSVTATPAIKYVFLHALNPFGFAWLRRVDENNVDLNRNFLLPGVRFEGAPMGYAQLDAFLNPPREPSRWEPFMAKAMWKIARHGLPFLRQAVAGGQHEYTRGLFFGGPGPSRVQQILDKHLAGWLRGAERVVHLDLHTGLGSRGTWKLLIDYRLSEVQRAWLTDVFGAGTYHEAGSESLAYEARGTLGRWCVSRHLAPDYLYACADFGTYGLGRVLAGLRAENQAHHWGMPASPSTLKAKERLKELFCPASEAWRAKTLAHGMELVDRAVAGLLDPLRAGNRT